MTFTSKMLDRCEAHSRMEIVILAIVAFLSPHKAHKAFLRFLFIFVFYLIFMFLMGRLLIQFLLKYGLRWTISSSKESPDPKIY